MAPYAEYGDELMGAYTDLRFLGTDGEEVHELLTEGG